MNTFTPENCAKLAQKGVSLMPLARVKNAMIRGPILLNFNALVQHACIDAFTTFGKNSECSNVQIGRYCTIGDCALVGLYHHDMFETSTNGIFSYTNDFEFFNYDSLKRMTNATANSRSVLGGKSYFNKVIVKQDVYIGPRVLCPTEVTINTGAYIKPGAIVTKDIPPFAIVEGNNRIVGYRFSDEVIADLLEIKWWNYNIPAMLQKGVQLPFDNIQEFISRFKDLEPQQRIIFDNKSIFVLIKSDDDEQNEQLEIKEITI